mgnify:FL=1
MTNVLKLLQYFKKVNLLNNFNLNYLEQISKSNILIKEFNIIILHILVSIIGYQPILEFIKNKKSICFICRNKFKNIISLKYSNSIFEIKSKNIEITYLINLINNHCSFNCNKCERVIINTNKINLNSPYKIFNLFDDLKGRINILISKNKNKITYNQIHKEKYELFYLLVCLIKLELRLISENIYKIKGKFKNGDYDIEFLNNNMEYRFTANEFAYLNCLREYDLTKIHSTSLKTHVSNYSFNVC